MVSGLTRFLLLSRRNYEFILIHINGISTNLHKQLSRVLGVFTFCPLASCDLKRLVSLRTSPLFGPFLVTNPKPKRWRTAIKARENQLLTLAKEALQEKKERRVIHFLDYIDQDIAA